jgi:hypothetical protein
MKRYMVRECITRPFAGYWDVIDTELDGCPIGHHASIRDATNVSRAMNLELWIARRVRDLEAKADVSRRSYDHAAACAMQQAAAQLSAVLRMSEEGS